MKDLTQGPIPRVLLMLATPVGAGLLLQSLWLLVDLYFVSSIGAGAVAGVGAAGTLLFLVLALQQVLAAGVIALVSQATGASNPAAASLAFNQAALLAVIFGAAVLVLGYFLAPDYSRFMTSDGSARREASLYLHAFLPGLAMSLLQSTIAAALRATGIVKPTVMIYMSTVVLNIVLTPVLIKGWGTGTPLGSMGAGLATSLSMAAGVLMLCAYLVRFGKGIVFDMRLWRPAADVCRRLLAIGTPAAAEYAFSFLYMTTMYKLLDQFGLPAQAAFGIGTRLIQNFLLVPAQAVTFAIAPIVGQNFGARSMERVRQAFATGLSLSVSFAAAGTLLVLWRSEYLMGLFTSDEEVRSMGSSYLYVVSTTMMAQAVVFSCSRTFQGLGNTVPAMYSAAAGFTLLCALSLSLSKILSADVVILWQLVTFTAWIQAAASLWLIYREFRKAEKHPLRSPHG